MRTLATQSYMYSEISSVTFQKK